MIYISSPPENISPELAKRRINDIKQKIFGLGALVIDPLKLGIPQHWSRTEQQKKRIEIIQEKATGIFMQNDWHKCQDAMEEFHAIYRFNQDRRNRQIHIYFEEMHGFDELQADLINQILIPEIH